jgi:salicylate hydroxylase
MAAFCNGYRLLAVVGCDEIKSGCRPFVYNDEKLVKPAFTKKVAYRGVASMKEAEVVLGKWNANNRQMYLGHGGHLLTFPVANGALMNLVAFHDSQKETWEGDWAQPLQKNNARRDFVGWGQKITKIIEVRSYGESHCKR